MEIVFYSASDALLVRIQRDPVSGIHSKGLIDLIPNECLTQSSTVLRDKLEGRLVGRIWIPAGELIYVRKLKEARGTARLFAAFWKWKSGSFETCPPNPAVTRTDFQNSGLNAFSSRRLKPIDETALPSGEVSGDQPEQRRTVRRLATSREPERICSNRLPKSGSLFRKDGGRTWYRKWGPGMRHARDVSHRISQRLQAGPLSHLEGTTMDHPELYYWPRKIRTTWSAGLPERRFQNSASRVNNWWHHGTLKLIFQAQSRAATAATGSMTIDRNCRVLATTISSSCPSELIQDIGSQVLRLFRRSAQSADASFQN